MKYLDIKGARMPALGFGTWRLSGKQCTDMVRYALDVGYRHIDTAQMYDNETEVGAALKGSDIDRADIFLTTKVWSDKLAYADVKRAAEDSLRKLDTDYVDLLLIHWPNSDIPLGETVRALNEVKAAGKARHIGVSNFNVALLREAVETHGAEIICNQIEYHPFLSQRRVLDYLRAQNMALTAYCPLAKGKTLSDTTLSEIGRQYGKTGAQVALRWFIEQDAVAAIPKAGSREHCIANLQIFDFSLSAEDMAAIAKLGGDNRLINPDWAPVWDPV